MSSRILRIRYLHFLFIVFLIVLLSSNKFHLSVVTISNGSYIDYSVSQAKKLIESEPDLFILDVRWDYEFQEGYIEGAVNINYTNIIERQDELPVNKSHPILVYCKSGGRSSTASATLVSLNYTRVYNLLGGFSEWKKNSSSTPSNHTSTPTTTLYSTNTTVNTINKTKPSSVITSAFEICFVFQAIGLMIIYVKKRR